jgi:hypothetical protein
MQDNEIISLIEKDNSFKKSKVLPFKVRRFQKLQNKLLDSAVPDGFC